LQHLFACAFVCVVPLRKYFDVICIFEFESRHCAGADCVRYTEPTPVQAKAIPKRCRSRSDVLGADGNRQDRGFRAARIAAPAQPAKAGRGPRVLVLTPTRELRFKSPPRSKNTASI
jgi:hypothetical protein